MDEWIDRVTRSQLRALAAWAATVGVVVCWVWADPSLVLARGATSPAERAERRAALWADVREVASRDPSRDAEPYFWQGGLLASGAYAPPLRAGAAWPPLLAAEDAIRGCVGERTFNFGVRAEVDGAPPEVVARSGDASRDECLAAVISALVLGAEIPEGAVLMVAGTTTTASLTTRRPLAPSGVPETRGSAGAALRVTRRWDGSRSYVVEVVPRAELQIDEALLQRVHELLECPAPVLGTDLDLYWVERDQVRGVPAGFTVRTDPPVPCVEERARAREPVLRDLLLDAVPDEFDRDPEVAASLGPRETWPHLTFQTFLLLPEEAR